MSIITLTTDYGLKDHFVGSLKGKIYTQFPEATIVDISHDIDPFNTTEASYIISAAYSNFPKGTIHIIGVDAELNAENKHVAIQWNGHYFIGADNGILSMLTHKVIPEKIVAINIHDRLLEDATAMDVFITVAVHLAKGGLLNVVGKDSPQLKEVTQLQPIVSDDKDSIKGSVIYIDHFGNVVTNITKKLFLEIGNARPYEIEMRGSGKKLKTILPNYSSIASSGPINEAAGERLAIFNEAGLLEIAIFKSNKSTVGSAHSLLGLQYRDNITIQFKK